MKFKNSPVSVNIKIILLIIGLLIALGTLFYTQNIVHKLQQRERELVKLYANGIEYVTRSNTNNSDLTFIFENIIKKIDFPLILTDSHNRVNLRGAEGGYRNINVDTTMSLPKLKAFFKEKIAELGKIHPPILVTYQDTIVLTKIYYGDSSLVKNLKYYPYFQIFFAVFFIIIAYIGFSHVKRTEQSNIWVGMAKETAHQLGTPISSLMGWTEILKMNIQNPEKVLDVTEEMERDLNRLNKITQRFSKIGSKPELKEESVFEVLQKVVNYFNRRLPQTSKNVFISIEGSQYIKVKLNAELFEWVIENLIKNALDAIGNNKGKITFVITESGKWVNVDAVDTGKGIDMKRRKDIFRPGFSTKRRGWGLGLSLSRRIIENYHKGKIILKHSSIGRGTTFRIYLKKG